MSDSKNSLRSSDLDALAQELAIQGDFQAAALLLMERLANRPPATSAAVLQAWVDLLSRQPGVAECAFLRADYSEGSLEYLASSAIVRRITALRNSSCRFRMLACLSSRQFLSDRLPRLAGKPWQPGVQLFVQPVIPTSLRALLVVISDGRGGCQIDYIVQAVATFAAALLAPAREQELAARVAHMTSGSILVAQFKLDSALRQMGDEPAVADQIQKALAALKDAQAGLDRARLFGLPWHGRAGRISLGPFLAKLGAQLNDEIQQEVVTEASLRACKRIQSMVVRATEERLRCALRDAILVTWLLCKRRTTSLSVARSDERVKARIRGDGTTLPRITRSADLLAILSDPAQYLSLPEKPAVRGVGLSLPRKLIEEMGGRMGARLLGADKCLDVLFEWPGLL